MSHRVPGPQKAQMSERIDLDLAIDHVASRLTHVDEDPMFAQRIVASLPERRTWFGWLAGHPALAALSVVAVVVTAAAVWSSRERSADPLANHSRAELSALVATVQPVEPVITEEVTVVRRPVVVALLQPDHERGLESLTVGSLVADAVPDEATLMLTPLSLTELPLTAETFSQQR